jgi:hypothetical protein
VDYSSLGLGKRASETKRIELEEDKRVRVISVGRGDVIC